MKRLNRTQLLLFALIVTPALCNGQTERITLNGRFDQGLFGWNNTTAPVQVKSRNYSAPFRPERPYDITLTNNYACVQGEGVGPYLGQVVPLPDSSRRQMLNCHAYKRATDLSGDGTFAAIFIAYYDEFWGQVDQFVQLIDPIDNTLPILGEGDGMNFYSAGITPPEEAKWVFMLISLDPGTEVLVDSFELIDYTIDALPLTAGIIANPKFRIGNVGNDSIQSRNNEFWFNFKDPAKTSRFEAGAFGSPIQAEYSYQLIPADDQTVYVLETRGNGTENTSASVGLDFYDANWNQIDKFIVNYWGQDYQKNELRRITPPPGTAHTSAFVYCGQAEGDRLDLFNFNLRPIASIQDNSTNAILVATSIGFPKSGPATRTMTIYLSDPDGIDVDSITDNSFYFETSESPETVMAILGTVESFDDDRLVSVEISTNQPFDARRLVIPGSGSTSPIRDKLGNSIWEKTFPDFDDLP